MEAKVLIASFVIAFIAVMTLSVAGVSAYTLVGDVTGDGLVDAKDIKAMRVAVAGSGLTVEQLATMPQLGVSENATLPDMNGDGRFYYDDIDIIVGIYSGTADVYGANSANRAPRTIVVGDVDGDGDFDMDDLKVLMDGDGIYGNYWNNVLPNYLNHGWLVFRQINIAV